MRGSVCFYLPCKDARALCQSVVGFTPATCCQKKKTTRVVNAFGSWNIFDVILFFLCFFLRGSISCQFRLCWLIHYLLGWVWKNLQGQLSLPLKCRPPAEKTKKWDGEYWDVWSGNCQWFDPKMTRKCEGVSISGVQVKLFVRSGFRRMIENTGKNLEFLIKGLCLVGYIWQANNDKLLIRGFISGVVLMGVVGSQGSHMAVLCLYSRRLGHLGYRFEMPPHDGFDEEHHGISTLSTIVGRIVLCSFLISSSYPLGTNDISGS